MAVGISVTKVVGRLIFDLRRDEDETTRSIDIPFPKTEVSSEELQTAVNTANTTFTDSSNAMNTFIQPANWRDTNTAEEQWTTTGVRYEIVSTTTTPIEPE